MRYFVLLVLFALLLTWLVFPHKGTPVSSYKSTATPLPAWDYADDPTPHSALQNPFVPKMTACAPGTDRVGYGCYPKCKLGFVHSANPYVCVKP